MKDYGVSKGTALSLVNQHHDELQQAFEDEVLPEDAAEKLANGLPLSALAATDPMHDGSFADFKAQVADRIAQEGLPRDSVNEATLQAAFDRGVTPQEVVQSLLGGVQGMASQLNTLQDFKDIMHDILINLDGAALDERDADALIASWGDRSIQEAMDSGMSPQELVDENSNRLSPARSMRGMSRRTAGTASGFRGWKSELFGLLENAGVQGDIDKKIMRIERDLQDAFDQGLTPEEALDLFDLPSGNDGFSRRPTSRSFARRAALSTSSERQWVEQVKDLLRQDSKEYANPAVARELDGNVFDWEQWSYGGEADSQSPEDWYRENKRMLVDEAKAMYDVLAKEAGQMYDDGSGQTDSQRKRSRVSMPHSRSFARRATDWVLRKLGLGRGAGMGFFEDNGPGTGRGPGGRSHQSLDVQNAVDRVAFMDELEACSSQDEQVELLQQELGLSRGAGMGGGNAALQNFAQDIMDAVLEELGGDSAFTEDDVQQALDDLDLE